jgi:tetratricopeptide (TPR) repeat protein
MSKKSGRQSKVTATSVKLPTPFQVHWTLAWLVLTICASIGYAWSAPAKFLFDSTYIVLDPQIKHVGSAIAAAFRTPFAPSQDLATATLAVNRSICLLLGKPEFHAPAFHAVNIFLHVVTTVLLFHLLSALLRHTSDAPSGNLVPLLVAMLFTVHPVSATSVAFAIQRRGIMVAAFFIIAMLAQLRLRNSNSRAESIAWLTVLLLSCWCGMKSKTMGMVIPLGLIALEVSLRLADLKQLRRFALVGSLILTASLMFIFAYLHSRRVFDLTKLSLIQKDWGNALETWPHFYTQLRIIWSYWAIIFLPLPAWLTPDHVVEASAKLTDHYAWAALLAHAALIAAALYAARRRWPLTCAGVLIFYTGMIPYLILSQPEWMVEYRTYVPLVGVAIALVEVFARASRSLPQPACTSVLLIVILAFLGVTIERNHVYVDAFRLWNDAAAKSHNNYRAHSNLGLAYAENGDHPQAIRQYQQSIRLQPNFPDAHFSLGLALVHEGRLDEALVSYNNAKSFMPYDLACYINIANVYTDQNRLDLAEAELRKAVELGLSAASLRPTWRAPLTTDSDSVLLSRAYFNLGNTVTRLGRGGEAADLYRAAIQYNPLHEKARYGLGLALMNEGKVVEAIEQFEAALAIKPDFEEPKIHLQRAMEFLNANRGNQ